MFELGICCVGWRKQRSAPRRLGLLAMLLATSLLALPSLVDLSRPDASRARVAGMILALASLPSFVKIARNRIAARDATD